MLEKVKVYLDLAEKLIDGETLEGAEAVIAQSMLYSGNLMIAMAYVHLEREQEDAAKNLIKSFLGGAE